MKDHLRARGVEFDAVNLQTEPAALEELRRHAVFSLPVVAVGDRYLGSPQLAEIDAALGIESEPAPLLPGDVLVERSRTLLAAAMRFARQLPREHYDDPTPGMEGSGPLILPDGTAVMLADGRPYLPHATSIGLVRHIVGHGVKVLLLATEPDCGLFADPATFGPLGEPDEALSLAQIEREAARVGSELQHAQPDVDRVVPTYMGQRKIHDVLQAMTYSLAQHTRQLEDVVRSLGFDPDGPLSEADYRGLGLPEAVWH